MPVPASQPRFLVHHDLGYEGGAKSSAYGTTLVARGFPEAADILFSDSDISMAVPFATAQRTFGGGSAGEGVV